MIFFTFMAMLEFGELIMLDDYHKHLDFPSYRIVDILVILLFRFYFCEIMNQTDRKAQLTIIILLIQ